MASDSSIERGAAALDKLAAKKGKRKPSTTTVLDASTSLLRSESGSIRPCEHNAYVLLAASEKHDDLHFDTFHHRMRIDDRDWSDADERAALLCLQSGHNVPGFSLRQVSTACRALADARKRDSLKEWIAALPQWDGVARIERAFCDAWGAPENALLCAASRNFFVALIARGERPGAKVDTLWCFEGPQGTYKSMALQELLPDFHAEISAPIGTTDFMRELLGVWLAELSELDSLRGREASTIKRLITVTADRFVQKYALHADSYRRRAVMVATTNDQQYWQDPSGGARRLVPIPCGNIRIDLIAQQREQWFAEAKALFDQGATWWDFPSAIRDAQEDRQQVDPWEDLLRGYMEHGRSTGIDGHGLIEWPKGWLSSAAIMRQWLRLEAHQQGQASSTRLGRVMRRLGYMPKRSQAGNERGWQPPESAAPDTSPRDASEVSGGVSEDVPL